MALLASEILDVLESVSKYDRYYAGQFDQEAIDWCLENKLIELHSTNFLGMSKIRLAKTPLQKKFSP